MNLKDCVFYKWGRQLDETEDQLESMKDHCFEAFVY